MEECFKCGAPESKTALFDAISPEGVVKICTKCTYDEDIPLIKRPKHLQFMDEKPLSVRERLSKMAKINPGDSRIKKSMELKNQEITLKTIMDRNAEKKVIQEAHSGEGLIRNFNWIIMRARRAKHLTTKQLAESIEEPESAIRLAERGIISKENPRLIRKVERALGISIIAEEMAFQTPVKNVKVLDLEKNSPEEFTIADLNAIKRRKEAEVFREKGERGNSKDSLEIEESSLDISSDFQEIPLEESSEIDVRKKGDLSSEEISDILFKRKK